MPLPFQDAANKKCPALRPLMKPACNDMLARVTGSDVA
jgi:hypothetical protein